MAAFATSYIPTQAASVTRSADVASVDTLSPWYNATEMTLFAEASYIGLVPSVSQTIAAFSDGPTNTNYIYFGKGGGSGQNATENLSSGSSNAVFSFGAPVVNTVYKLAMAIKLNDFAGCLNGGAVSTDTSGAVASSISMLGIGSLNSGAPLQLNGHVRRIAYYPRRLLAAELQALTA
jgi:hypothetical protein